VSSSSANDGRRTRCQGSLSPNCTCTFIEWPLALESLLAAQPTPQRHSPTTEATSRGMLDRPIRLSNNNPRPSLSAAGRFHKGHGCAPRDSTQRRCRSLDTIRSSASSPNANCTKQTQPVTPVARPNNQVLISVTFRIDTLYQSLRTTLFVSLSVSPVSQPACRHYAVTISSLAIRPPGFAPTIAFNCDRSLDHPCNTHFKNRFRNRVE
jgi:hypothetical protein